MNNPARKTKGGADNRRLFSVRYSPVCLCSLYSIWRSAMKTSDCGTY
ncbi:hypothetical protein PO124_10165 [Bacillus licheniformis]|nr:hypothetical protein [Bacillus licheniformis]